MNLEKFNVEEGKEYIYLVMVEYKDETLLKIGYTKTINNRMDTYELHNPGIKLLNIKEGTRDLESYMHKKFEKYAYPKRREWFYYNKEIILTFDLLEEKFSLDIDQLKKKVYNLLKPKSIGELKRNYYEKYQKDLCEDENILNNIITYTFDFISDKINNFIYNLDYSEIPSEIELKTNYKFMIPNPLASTDFLMSLEQIFGCRGSKINLRDNYSTIHIKNKNHKSIRYEFDEYIKKKLKMSKLLIKAYNIEDDEESRLYLAEVYMRVEKAYSYFDDYITVRKTINKQTGEIERLKPFINNSVYIIEDRIFELFQKDYEDRFNVFSVSQLEETKN